MALSIRDLTINNFNKAEVCLCRLTLFSMLQLNIQPDTALHCDKTQPFIVKDRESWTIELFDFRMPYKIFNIRRPLCVIMYLNISGKIWMEINLSKLFFVFFSWYVLNHTYLCIYLKLNKPCNVLASCLDLDWPKLDCWIGLWKP